MREYPVPKDAKELRSITSLAGYYRRFILGFSQVAAPLFAILETNSQFVWSAECQGAFDELKYRLITSPVLVFPQFEHMFKLATYASNVGLGAVLFQEYNGRKHNIAYASLSLHPLRKTTQPRSGKH